MSLLGEGPRVPMIATSERTSNNSNPTSKARVAFNAALLAIFATAVGSFVECPPHHHPNLEESAVSTVPQDAE